MIEYHLREVTPEDAALLCEIYRTSRLEEVRAWGWPEELVTAFLRQQWDVERRARPMQFPKAAHHIVVVGGRDAGRVMIDRDQERILLVDIALLPEARGLGVGTQILGALAEEAQRNGLPVELTVERGSRAEHLYRRLGYVVVTESPMHFRMLHFPPGVAAAVA